MMGETGVVSIKVMTNKFTGEPAGYGFINFDSDQTAIIAMHRMGGKVRMAINDHEHHGDSCLFQIIPNSNPPVRFKLNHNSTRLAPGEVVSYSWLILDTTENMFVFRLIHPSGLATSLQRWTTLLCTDTSLKDMAQSDAPRYIHI